MRDQVAHELRRASVVLVTVVLTACVTLLGANLTSRAVSVETPLPHAYGVRDGQFARAMASLVGPAMLAGNEIVPLQNGDRIFPAMLAAIRAARRTITFESYIYWSGEVGRAFTEALSERARSGVKCHLLLDWVGSDRMDKAMLEQMRRAGVEVERYHPVRWYDLTRLNNRTHRKILVVDGTTAFTGGVGVADHWLGNADSPRHWRDSHFRVEGPVVAQMQSVFMDNWLKTHRRVLDGDGYFPPLQPRGAALAQVVRSSGDEGTESARLMFLLAIAAAERSIHIANSYFLPDELSVRMLTAARRRGVDVELIVPGDHIDTPLVMPASRASWGELLEAGIGIYRFQPTMFHCKTMVVDGAWSSVGSTNFDDRSFRLNDEENLNVLDAGFAAQLERVFEQDRQRSRRVTLGEWRSRPLREKLGELFSAPFASQL